MYEQSAGRTGFKIGLAMAGAVSAGAYTAGVLDFLLEALDTWYDAKQRPDSQVPQHQVSLDVAAGASAGAMCAALLAIMLPYEFPHVRLRADGTPEVVGAAAPNASPEHNPLYRAWVETIDIARLLETSDIDAGKLASLLDCRVIDQIVADSLGYTAGPKLRPYVGCPFAARFTLGNLRGVPYSIDFLSNRKNGQEAMFEHADRRDFLIAGPQETRTGGLAADDPRLPAQSIGDPRKWRALGDAAVASGAFPLFLKPRLITRAAADYGARHRVAQNLVQDDAIPPAWDPAVPQPYAFACVDGGVFNNEPFELAHEVITDNVAGNPRDGRDARAAVLMVAPFMSRSSNGAEPATTPDGELILPPESQIGPLMNAWIRQSRFKPADLALAYAEDVYSRFVIAPAASKAPEKAGYWIASGGLGGFFGFFHEAFRKHDYQLGRRNCQQFLKQHFVLPVANDLVQQGYAQLNASERSHYWVAPSADDLLRDAAHQGYLPIVPLLGRVRDEEPLLEWPAGEFQPDAVMDKVAARVTAVFDHYAEQLSAGASPWPLRKSLRLAIAAAGLLAKPWLCNQIRERLDAERAQQGL